MAARRDASSRVGAAIGQSPSQSQRSSLAKKIARFERADENSRGTQKFDGSMGEETARPVGARPMARPSGKTPLKVRRFAIIGHPSPLSRLSNNRCAHLLSPERGQTRRRADPTLPTVTERKQRQSQPQRLPHRVQGARRAGRGVAGRGPHRLGRRRRGARTKRWRQSSGGGGGGVGGRRGEADTDLVPRVQVPQGGVRGEGARGDGGEEADARAHRASERRGPKGQTFDSRRRRRRRDRVPRAPRVARGRARARERLAHRRRLQVLRQGRRSEGHPAQGSRIHRREADPKNAGSSRRAGGDAGERPARGRRRGSGYASPTSAR